MEDAPHGFLSDAILFVNTFCGLIIPFFPWLKNKPRNCSVISVSMQMRFEN